jgi:hypothetical protein
MHKPDYLSLKVFGCACWPNLHPYNIHKLQFRSKHCVFLRYNTMHKGYKCLDVSSGRVYVSRDVTFDENIFPFSHLHSMLVLVFVLKFHAFIQLCLILFMGYTESLIN